LDLHSSPFIDRSAFQGCFPWCESFISITFHEGRWLRAVGGFAFARTLLTVPGDAGSFQLSPWWAIAFRFSFPGLSRLFIRDISSEYLIRNLQTEGRVAID
jgi:hypothetical protein